MILQGGKGGSGSSGGNTIYTGDGSLSGNRTVYLDGHTLTFRDGAYSFLIDFPSIETNGDISADTVEANNVFICGAISGVSGTFVDKADQTIAVTGGIITSIG